MGGMAWLRRGVVSLVIAATSATPALAQQGATRGFSLDSRYLLGPASNSAAVRFGLDMATLATLPGDLLLEGSDSRGRAIAASWLVFATSYYLNEGFSLAYHEYGHGTRNGALGYRTRYGFGTLRSDADVTAALAGGELHDTFLSFYLRTFYSSGGFAIRDATDPLFAPVDEAAEPAVGWNVARRAGGMNNEMLVAQVIDDDVQRSGGHVGLFTLYVKGKLSSSPMSQSSRDVGDIGRVVTGYADRGISISADDIERASVTAFLLSGLSYQITFETLAALTGRPFRFDAWTLGPVEMPSTSFYMNRDGLSYRFATGVRHRGWRFPVAIEQLFDGRERTEVTVGAELLQGRATGSAAVTWGRRLAWELAVGTDVSPRVRIEGGYTVFDARNLRGERVIPSLEGGARYHDLFVRGVLRY